MADDIIQRAQAALERLHKRSLALAHPNQNNDMGEALQALALIMELQIKIARQTAGS
jgi:hypothetical protein